MIWGKPTFDELRFVFTTSQLKEYAKRIQCDISDCNDKKPKIVKKIMEHLKWA